MRTVLCWSSGKDCAWALHVLRNDPAHEVVGLLTTINARAKRVAMHAVRENLLDAQAAAVGLPLLKVPIPSPCSNEDYQAAMVAAMDRVRADGVQAIAFGDLFLDEVRRYRERNLASTGIAPLFPLWGRSTSELAREMVGAGLRAHITCVDPKLLDPSFIGRTFDTAFLDDLPAAADPCGENGEYHSFAFAGPMFRSPLAIEPGAVVQRDGFAFADLRLPGSAPDRVPAWIPTEALDRLDLGELEQDDESALRECDRIERELGVHIAAYRREAQGRPHGLCSVYDSADLPTSGIARLKAAEKLFPRVVFVAYARPLQERARRVDAEGPTPRSAGSRAGDAVPRVEDVLARVGRKEIGRCASH